MDRCYALADLRAWAGGLLRHLGAPPAVAEVVARHLVEADATGHRGHGLSMLPTYLDSIQAGDLVAAAEPAVIEERPARLVVDGHHGFGHYTIEWTLARVVDLARAQGVAAASVVRCGHAGRLGGYAIEGARRSAAVLLCVGTVADRHDALVAAHGGREPLLGTNPIAFGCPGDPPFVMDMATSSIAYYELLEIARRGGTVPPGVILDADGGPTTNAADLLRGGAMLPFGGYKGYALSVAVGLLGGLGAHGSAAAINGAFLLAIDLRGWDDAEQGQGATLGAALDRLRSTPPVHNGQPVLVPGDRSRRNLARSRSSGVQLPSRLVEDLEARLAVEGVAFPPLPDPIGVQARDQPA